MRFSFTFRNVKLITFRTTMRFSLKTSFDVTIILLILSILFLIDF